MQGPPDFVILGTPHADGVAVHASNLILGAEVHTEMARPYFMLNGGMGPFEPTRYEIRTELGNLLIATGANYGEAFRKLFGQWEPERAPEQRGVGPGRRGLRP